jgi:DNA-binding response OmpR family regulator
MSANVTDDVRKRARELRADGLFQKPFEMRDLRRDVGSLIRRSKSSRSVAPTLPDIS